MSYLLKSHLYSRFKALLDRISRNLLGRCWSSESCRTYGSPCSGVASRARHRVNIWEGRLSKASEEEFRMMINKY